MKELRIWSEETGTVVFTVPDDATEEEKLRAAREALKAARASRP